MPFVRQFCQQDIKKTPSTYLGVLKQQLTITLSEETNVHLV